MRRILTLLAAFCGAGLLGLALLAYRLGIDNDPGWGKGRTALAAVGGALLAAAGLAWQWGRISPLAGRLLAAAWARLSGLPAVQQAKRAWARALRLPGVAWLAASPERRARLACWLGVGVILLAQAWYFSAGTLTRWFAYPHAYFDRQAEAFLHGQLNLLEQPSPALLALADPYPYENRTGLEYLWDVSFYQGKFYLYWGPTPALVLAAFKAALGAHIEDQALAAGFLGGLICLMAGLACAIRRQFFPETGAGGLFLLLLAGGLNLYMLWPSGRPGVYESAILAGQFFLAAGLAALFTVLRPPRARPGWMLLAGASLALAVGARVTLAAPAGWLALAAAWRAWRLAKSGAGRPGAALAALLLPLLLGAAGLMWFNAARFGSPFETGIRYQLGIPQFPHDLANLFSPAYLLPNLFGYLLRAPAFEGAFPYVSVPFVKEAAWPWWIRLPESYIYHEPQAGLLAACPVLLLGAVAAVNALRRGARGEGFEKWFGGALAGALLAQALVLLLYFFSSIRYQLELAPVGFLLACLGFWQAQRSLAARPGWRGLFRLAVATLAIYSLALGLLGGFTAGDRRFEANNPHLYGLLRDSAPLILEKPR